jgi:hypothetical protein
VLDEVSEFYSRELKSVIKTRDVDDRAAHDRASWASVVGFIAMSIILPIFKLSSLVK